MSSRLINIKRNRRRNAIGEPQGDAITQDASEHRHAAANFHRFADYVCGGTRSDSRRILLLGHALAPPKSDKHLTRYFSGAFWHEFSGTTGFEIVRHGGQ
jgi:hypothetical protein